jgi:hypothetical protein
VPSGLDNDCSVCHAGCAAAIGDIVRQLNVEVAAIKGPMKLGGLVVVIPSKPERPKWALSA